MKIDGRYEIRVVVLEIVDGVGAYNSIGDVYDDFQKFKMEKPESGYKFGFCVVDTETGYIPEECNEWNDTVEEALFDYEDNCQ